MLFCSCWERRVAVFSSLSFSGQLKEHTFSLCNPIKKKQPRSNKKDKIPTIPTFGMWPG